jgi:hypothetical protein
MSLEVKTCEIVLVRALANRFLSRLKPNSYTIYSHAISWSS